MSIKNLPIHQRPREKLQTLGADNLSDVELVAILLGSGSRKFSAIELAQKILHKYPLKILVKTDLNKLIDQIDGVSLGKGASLVSAFELGKRVWQNREKGPIEIIDSETAYLLLSSIAKKKQEHLVALYLNAKNQIIEQQTISIGLIDSSLIHPREVFYPAIANLASKVIIAHNHPSGDFNPSEMDLKITSQLIASSQILDIELVDHLIITENGYFSMADEGIIE